MIVAGKLRVIIFSIFQIFFSFLFLVTPHSMQYLPWPGIEPLPLPAGAQSLNHCTIMEVPKFSLTNAILFLQCRTWKIKLVWKKNQICQLQTPVDWKFLFSNVKTSWEWHWIASNFLTQYCSDLNTKLTVGQNGGLGYGREESNF